MNPQRIVRSSLLAMACVAAVAAATSPTRAAAAAGDSGVLTVFPAHPDPSVAAGTAYFVHSLAPGTTWSDDVAVANTNNATIEAWVDPVDGVTSIRTGAVYTARTLPLTGPGAWVKPSLTSITVPPHTQTVISVTGQVPRDARVGDHVAGIAFESKQGHSSLGTEGITTVLRSVVAVQVRVPGPAEFRLQVYGATVEAVSTTGTAGIAVDMADAGALLGKPRLEVTLDCPAGYHRSLSLGLDTMLPGDRITDELLWPDALAPGDCRLSITEDGSGRHGTPFVTTTHLATALHPSTPPPAGTGVAVAPGRGLPTWVIIGSSAGGAGIVLLVILLFLRGRRSRCLHCHRGGGRGGGLLRVTDVDQIGGCVSCGVAVHNSGSGLLCETCLRSHRRLASAADRRGAPAERAGL